MNPNEKNPENTPANGTSTEAENRDYLEALLGNETLCYIGPKI